MKTEDIILLAGAGLLYMVIVWLSAPSATSFAGFFKAFNSQKREPHILFSVLMLTNINIYGLMVCTALFCLNSLVCQRRAVTVSHATV